MRRRPILIILILAAILAVTAVKTLAGQGKEKAKA